MTNNTAPRTFAAIRTDLDELYALPVPNSTARSTVLDSLVREMIDAVEVALVGHFDEPLAVYRDCLDRTGRNIPVEVANRLAAECDRRIAEQ